MNLGQFETAASNEFGLSLTNATEKQTIDDALNVATQRVLEDTHCYVKGSTFTDFDGSSADYTFGTSILEIVDMQLSSAGVPYTLERLSIVDLLESRRTGATTGSPARFYAVSGANLMLFYPTPGAADSLVVYFVPIPTPLAAPADDPSNPAFGGVPTLLHEAIFLYACSKLASYDDDQSSAQGQRYRDWYDKEITRYKEIVRKRGGTRNARAVVNSKRKSRANHTNDIYPSA